MAEKDDKDVHSHDSDVYSDLEQNSIRSDSLEESAHSDATTSSSVSSLLDRLRAPTPSMLARKRKIKLNPPPKGMKRGKGKDNGDPKSISPAERVKVYPDEGFSVSNGKLFCRACREELATKKSSLDSHIKSHKHLNGKRRLESKDKEEADILAALKAYDTQVHPAGESLPDSTRIYRVKVVMTMLKAGVPLSKIDHFRDLLEENGFSLTSSTHLRHSD